MSYYYLKCLSKLKKNKNLSKTDFIFCRLKRKIYRGYQLNKMTEDIEIERAVQLIKPVKKVKKILK